MAFSKTKIRYYNRLWRARKQLGLTQPQVQKLLDLRSNGILSEYEHGFKLPTLEVALMLEIIYDMPIRAMFPKLTKELTSRLQRQIGKSPILYKKLLTRLEEIKDYCTYTKPLDEDNPAQTDLDKLRRHITATMRKLAYI